MSVPALVLAVLLPACNTLPVVESIAQPPVNRLVVFGASLCDTGNFRLATGVLPLPPYWSGRFTDGATWVEVLAQRWGLQVAPSRSGGTNYATGFSTSGEGGRTILPFLPAVPNLLEQITTAETTYDGNELVIIWSGLNDGILAMLEGLEGDALAESAGSAAANIGTAVSFLQAQGARQFLIAEMMDMGRLPLFSLTGQSTRATAWSDAYNAALHHQLDLLASNHPLQIHRLPVRTWFDAWQTQPPAGISETVRPAWNSSLLGMLLGALDFGLLSPNPQTHFHWDLVHPGRIVHQQLGLSAAELVSTP